MYGIYIPFGVQCLNAAGIVWFIAYFVQTDSQS